MRFSTTVIVFLATILTGCKGIGQQLPNTTFTFLTSDHIKLPVKVAGAGQPCMLVQGGPGDSFISFEKLGGSNLEKKLTLVYMEQRGAGLAQKADNYSLDRMVKDIEELRAKLKIDKMYLLSHSFGGILLINYAKKYPQHVKGLILANSTLHFFSVQMLRESIKYGYSQLNKDTTISQTNPDSLFVDYMSLRQKMSKRHIAYKFLTDDIQTIVATDKLDSLYPRTNDFAYKILGPVLDKTKKMIYPEYFKDYYPLTATIKAPALIINGTKDHAVGPDHYKLYKFPNQQVVQINGGHMLYYENNKAFTDAVWRFTDSH